MSYIKYPFLLTVENHQWRDDTDLHLNENAIVERHPVKKKFGIRGKIKLKKIFSNILIFSAILLLFVLMSLAVLS